jgi:mono/diheme cytochrome c family protein
MKYILLAAISLCSASVSLASEESAEASPSTGKAFERCAVCHLPDGTGIPGSFPALRDRLGPWAGTDEGRRYLMMVVLVGLSGLMTIDGTSYYVPMAPQSSSLSDEEIAAALNYVIENFNANTKTDTWTAFRAEDVAAIRSSLTDETGRSVMALRKALVQQ